MILLQINPQRIRVLPLEGDAPRSVDVEGIAPGYTLQAVEVKTRAVNILQCLRLIQRVESLQTTRLQILTSYARIWCMSQG